MDVINPNCRAEISFSNEGHRIIIRQHPNTPKPFRLGSFVLCRYQTTGITPGVQIVMPEYAANRFYTGLYYEFIRLKDRYTLSEKEAAKIQRDMEDDNLVLYLNKLLLKPMAQVQDAPIRY